MFLHKYLQPLTEVELIGDREEIGSNKLILSNLLKSSFKNKHYILKPWYTIYESFLQFGLELIE